MFSTAWFFIFNRLTFLFSTAWMLFFCKPLDRFFYALSFLTAWFPKQLTVFFDCRRARTAPSAWSFYAFDAVHRQERRAWTPSVNTLFDWICFFTHQNIFYYETHWNFSTQTYYWKFSAICSGCLRRSRAICVYGNLKTGSRVPGFHSSRVRAEPWNSGTWNPGTSIFRGLFRESYFFSVFPYIAYLISKTWRR